MNENKTESPDEESAAECETRWVAKKTERRSPISGPSVKRESHRDSFMRCQLGKSRYQSKRKKQNKTKQNRRRTKTRTHSAASINPKPARWKERNKKKQLKNAVKHRISGNILWGDRAVLLFGGTRNKEEEEEEKNEANGWVETVRNRYVPSFFFFGIGDVLFWFYLDTTAKGFQRRRERYLVRLYWLFFFWEFQ